MFPLLGGAIAPDEYPAMLLAECARLNRAGLTTCSEMAFDPTLRPGARGAARPPDGPAAHLRDVQPGDVDRRHARPGRRHRAAGRHQDLGRRLAVDRQHRAVVPVPRHRGHPHHRRDARLLRPRQLHRRTAHRDRRRLLPAGLADGLPRAGRRRRRHHPRRVRASAATQSARRPPAAARARRRDPATSSCSAPTTSASPAASSSTRSTTGATSSSTGCSARSADRVGCRQVPRWPPACGSRCTTIRR